MITAHRIRLDPTVRQAQHFVQACGVARFAWNWCLDFWDYQYKAGNKPNVNKVKAVWNQNRRELFPWSYEVTKCASNQAVKNLGKAFANFFRDLKKPIKERKFSYPVPKRKGKCKDSFALWNDQFSVTGKKIRIPQLGWVRMCEELRFSGKILGAVVSRTADHWYVSIQVETTGPASLEQPQESVGIDVGVKDLLVLSKPTTGGVQKIGNPKHYKHAAKRLKRLQRSVSRQENQRKARGAGKSKRAVKQLTRLARQHARVAALRADTLHKATTMVAREFKTVCLEDLNTAGMLKNHKLAGALQDASFYEIRRQLEYKVSRSGGHVLFCSTWFPSTKTCSACRVVQASIPLNVRYWRCPACGKYHDRDINAAINIEDECLRVREAIPEPAGTSQLTHGENLALASGQPRVKLGSRNREHHREPLCSQR